MFFAQSITFFFFAKRAGSSGRKPENLEFFSVFFPNLAPPRPPTNPDTFLKRIFYTLTETTLQSGVF